MTFESLKDLVVFLCNVAAEPFDGMAVW